MQEFGGTWTQKKLAALAKYMKAYTTALKNQNFFNLIYIDAFAGSGHRSDAPDSDEGNEIVELFEKTEAKSRLVFEGSTAIALQNEPPFDRYIFIEKNQKNIQLHQMVEENGGNEKQVDIIAGDANHELLEIIETIDWRRNRALLFLDPFGAQVEWSTLEKIASTKAIDVWYLFPSGIAVNRMLPKNKPTPQSWSNRLDKLFGSNDWYEMAYTTHQPVQETLFPSDPSIPEKTADIQKIEVYFTQRLQTIFSYVGEPPIAINSPLGIQMYSLYFGTSNPSPKAVALCRKLYTSMYSGD